ncbi:MAG: glycosyl hydrolase [Chromatiales bacterium]|nr:glycosyl hydrolase [Chromatiales bacterium]
MARSARKTAARKRRPVARTKASRVLVTVATRKGALAPARRCRAQDLAPRRAALSRPDLQPRGARSARRAHAAGGGEDRAPRPDGLPLHRSRPQLEGSRAAAGLRQGARRAPRARAVDHTFWLTPGHANEPSAWYAGTSPAGAVPLRRRRRHLETVLASSTTTRSTSQWMGTVQDGTPDGPKMHSIIVDPRDPGASLLRHVGRRRARIHRTAAGPSRRWCKGMEVVEGFDAANIAFHDPHCVRLCPSNPDRLYQQNHCGIYRLDRPSTTWVRIGRSMPKQVGDIGFPMVVHPRDADTAWVFPMDGQTVWPRTSPDGKPAAYVTRNGGKTLAAPRQRPARPARPGGRSSARP